MFKLILYTAFFLVILTACHSTQQGSEKLRTGLIDNQLLPCPSSPNCVCSEIQGLASSITPLKYQINSAKAWNNAKSTINRMGGQIIEHDERYIHAIFTSRIFRFVDDFELRLDRENRVIHLRSASRTGYSDLGVNRKRTEQFKELFTAMTR